MLAFEYEQWNHWYLIPNFLIDKLISKIHKNSYLTFIAMNSTFLFNYCHAGLDTHTEKINDHLQGLLVFYIYFFLQQLCPHSLQNKQNWPNIYTHLNIYVYNLSCYRIYNISGINNLQWEMKGETRIPGEGFFPR